MRGVDGTVIPVVCQRGIYAYYRRLLPLLCAIYAKTVATVLISRNMFWYRSYKSLFWTPVLRPRWTYGNSHPLV